MRIDILTIFPEMFDGVLGASMLSRAAANGILDFRTHNIRDYSLNKHHNTDDYPYGGGAGMVMLAQPIMDCIDAVTAESGIKPRRILMTPRGRQLSTELARELASEERLLILAGHYEGIDERVMALIDDEISIGDYILTGGELPAMVLIDCVSRFVPGVLGSAESAEDESFSEAGLLEYPQYTRPAEYRGMQVPEVLLNGNHAEIRKWRRQQALKKTAQNRPDLLKAAALDKHDIAFLASLNTADNEDPSED
ncbi:MAG: tRNA (guanosine(37)-N1)-methyltransferase TrmD [Clostridia bacterium]|nr:tRNA (guanosine(37)-N1)-methyltransferase TrmD [Clostridia bacterium]